MRNDITKSVQGCLVCQKTKRQRKKYGHLPAKQAEATPWDVLCVDLIGPYIIRRKGKEPLRLHAITMIDPATGWFELHELPGDKKAHTVAQIK